MELSNIFLHLTLIIIFLTSSSCITSSCNPLFQREGVDVSCRHPDTGDLINCYKNNLPFETVAKYKCSQYYIPTNPDLINGQIICDQRRKRWFDDFIFTFVFSCKIDCGVPKNTRGLIVNGEETEPSKWPWHASIYAKENLNDPKFQYICGGTLIKPYSKGFVVLSAAHCFSNGKSETKDPKLYKVVLGADSSSYEENEKNKDANIYGVSKVIAHDSYSRSNYQGDIAIAFLDAPVKLSPKILPACFSTSLDIAQPNKFGKLVGFGRYNLSISTVSYTLRQVTLPIVSDSFCSWRETKLQPLEICAGVQNGASACSGDSGGGLVIQDVVDDNVKRYYVQGVVSAGPISLTDPKDMCNSYSIFTRVRSYAEWIQTTTSLNFDESFIDSESEPRNNWPINFTQAGEFEGRKYYTNPDLNISWDDAKIYCKRVGMESVTLESDSEIEYLKTLTDNGDRRYWTSAISTTIFHWDFGDGSLVTIPVGSVKQFCVLVTYWGIYADACDGSYGFKYQPLCTVNANSNSSAPVGDGECSLKFSPNLCWRYCNGKSGNFCYTHSGCENNCNFYKCTEKCRKESDLGCVNSC